MIPFICGANLASLKNGGAFVTLQLVKCCITFFLNVSLFVKSDSIQAIFPVQLGVGIPGGDEAFNHAANLIHYDESQHYRFTYDVPGNFLPPAIPCSLVQMLLWVSLPNSLIWRQLSASILEGKW